MPKRKTISDYIADLASPDPQIKIKALKKLGKSGPRAAHAVSKIIPLLHDNAWRVRAWAARSLGYIGPQAAAAIPHLIEALNDEMATVRSDAALGLSYMGEKAGPAVPMLIKALNDPKWSVRISASNALGQIGEPAAVAIKDLTEIACESKDLNEQYVASMAIDKISIKTMRIEEPQNAEDLQRFIEAADRLATAGQPDQAQEAYHACLELAAGHHIPLFAGQLVQIWVGIGFCAADQRDWADALAWYHRAEAAIYSAPFFNPDPDSPEARVQAEQWSCYLPKGLIVLFSENYPAETQLAFLCDSIALAYDNADELPYAELYYQRSAGLHARLGEPFHEAEVWYHQSIGCQRREDWVKLEEIAQKLAAAAERANFQPLRLAAERLLTQSFFNRGRLQETLDHLGRAVVLGREINHPDIEEDEGQLRELVEQLQPGIIERNAPEELAALAAAEQILIE
ncbi:MAG: HEAT repeat domain-containing protein [Ardenticatenaceae bacterium]|nr:HEAT repeat domain-containing protein [Ardenticatenaceae bacterium]